MQKLEDMRPIIEEFKKEYMTKDPYKKYISGYGTFPVKSVISNTDLEGFCLQVNLKKPVPKELEMPSDYKGMLITYKVMPRTIL
jgi:hypothetical protein